MDKYIVEIDGKNICSDADGKSKLALSVKADNGYAVFCTEIPLTPYTEPDLDAIRDEAYEKGVQDTKQHWVDAPRSCAYKLGYENGLNDAWEIARKIASDNAGRNYSIFGQHFTAEILNTHSASEALEEIRAHEQAQKEKEEQEEKDSVTAEDVMRQYLNIFCYGRNCATCPLNTPNFTCGRGRHFLTSPPVSDEEVRRAYVEVLKKDEG